MTLALGVRNSVVNVFVAAAPPSRSSTRCAASSSMCGSTCAYKSSVIPICECPSTSERVRISTGPLNITLAPE